MLRVAMLSMDMLSVIVMSAIKMNVFMLTVVECCDNIICHYAECHRTECRYSECSYAGCLYAECHCTLNNLIYLKFKAIFIQQNMNSLCSLFFFEFSWEIFLRIWSGVAAEEWGTLRILGSSFPPLSNKARQLHLSRKTVSKELLPRV